jgi:hypothetical protein
MNSPTPLPEFLARARACSTLVAAVAGTALVIGGILDRDQFFQSWLLAWLFWLAPALGSLGVVMLHHLTGGSWGFAVRRLLEGASRTLPWMALLFLPVLLGMGSLYEWTHADVVAADPILTRKSAYLNVPFFTLRAGVYFAIWIALARAQVRLAERYDRAPDPSTKRSLQRLSGLGLVLYVSTMTFASVDWVMSLEPHWFSTIYGVHFVVGQVLSTLCLAVVFSSLLGGECRQRGSAAALDPPVGADDGDLLWGVVAEQHSRGRGAGHDRGPDCGVRVVDRGAHATGAAGAECWINFSTLCGV